MSSTLPPVAPLRWVVGSEEQELSISPSALPEHGHPWPFPRAGCPTCFSLRGQREVGKRKATPRPRPPRIPALRVREPRPVFVDSASLHRHEHRRPPCRRPCGLIDRASPLPRGPLEKRGLLPAGATAEAEASIGWVLTHRSPTLASVLRSTNVTHCIRRNRSACEPAPASPACVDPRGPAPAEAHHPHRSSCSCCASCVTPRSRAKAALERPPHCGAA
jgi:hypothetical protein